MICKCHNFHIPVFMIFWHPHENDWEVTARNLTHTHSTSPSSGFWFGLASDLAVSSFGRMKCNMIHGNMIHMLLLSLCAGHLWFGYYLIGVEFFWLKILVLILLLISVLISFCAFCPSWTLQIATASSSREQRWRSLMTKFGICQMYNKESIFISFFSIDLSFWLEIYLALS